MRVTMISQNRFADVVKLHAALDKLPQTLRQQAQFRPCGQTVQYIDLSLCVLRLVLICCQQSRIVTSGQGAGDRNNKHPVSTLIGRQPVCHIGARGTGFPFVSAQGLRHAYSIQMAVVQILLLVGHDLQRHTGKIHAVQRIQAGRGVYNDLGFHTQFSIHSFYGKPDTLRLVIRDHCEHHISFSKTCQEVSIILQKVFASR